MARPTPPSAAVEDLRRLTWSLCAALLCAAVPARGDEPWAIGEAHAKRLVVAPARPIVSRRIPRQGELSVATSRGPKSTSVAVTSTILKEVSSLWGLALLEVKEAPTREATVNQVRVRSVPLVLGEWLTRPAGLDAVAITSPVDVPLGTWVVDDRKRVVGIVSRVAQHDGLVLVRPRTLNLLASANVCGELAPLVPAVPVALVVDDQRVPKLLVRGKEEHDAQPGEPTIAGDAPVDASTGTVTPEAEASLRSGGVRIGGDGDRVDTVLLADSVELRAVLERVTRTLRGAPPPRLVLHVLPSPATSAEGGGSLALACALARRGTATWAALENAVTSGEPGAPACTPDQALAVQRDEAQRLAAAHIESSAIVVDGIVVPLSEPDPVLRATLTREPTAP